MRPLPKFQQWCVGEELDQKATKSEKLPEFKTKVKVSSFDEPYLFPGWKQLVLQHNYDYPFFAELVI